MKEEEIKEKETLIRKKIEEEDLAEAMKLKGVRKIQARGTSYRTSI